MRPSESLSGLQEDRCGYAYPKLAKPLGGVNAATIRSFFSTRKHDKTQTN